MKKILALALALSMSLTLAACGGGDSGKSSANPGGSGSGQGNVSTPVNPGNQDGKNTVYVLGPPPTTAGPLRPAPMPRPSVRRSPRLASTRPLTSPPPPVRSRWTTATPSSPTTTRPWSS